MNEARVFGVNQFTGKYLNDVEYKRMWFKNKAEFHWFLILITSLVEVNQATFAWSFLKHQSSCTTSQQVKQIGRW